MRYSVMTALCILLAANVSMASKKSSSKSKEMTKICKEEMPDASKAEIKKCVKGKMKKGKG